MKLKSAAGQKLNGQMKKYEFFNHTADIGIRVYGKTRQELFENAALALFDIIAVLDKLEPRQLRTVSLTAGSYEELLVAWLNELLFLFDSEGFLAKEFSVKIKGNRLEAKVRGEPLPPAKADLKTEVKAATYHNLKIEKTQEGFKAEVVLDV